MRVRYFIEIIRVLITKGASQNEIAQVLGFTKQNMTEILGGVPEKQRKNLKDEHLPGLLKLCRKYEVEPQTPAALMKMIELEKRQEREKVSR